MINVRQWDSKSNKYLSHAVKNQFATDSKVAKATEMSSVG